MLGLSMEARGWLVAAVLVLPALLSEFCAALFLRSGSLLFCRDFASQEILRVDFIFATVSED